MRNEQNSLQLTIPPGGATLDILVENMGRINYGPLLHDRKGITHGVLLQNQFLYHWEVFTLPLDNLQVLKFEQEVDDQKVPGFYQGTFEVQGRSDTFVRLPGWVKGVCFVNGFNLGRYWERGPQQTLYLPAPLLRDGTNEIVIFELEQVPGSRTIELIDQPDLG